MTMSDYDETEKSENENPEAEESENDAPVDLDAAIFDSLWAEVSGQRFED